MDFASQANDLFGVTLSAEQVGQFETYQQQLIDWNQHVNLTAITEPEAIQTRHFLDSLSIVQAHSMRDGLRVVDIGTGAGFPGLPLSIAYPTIHMHLIDSTGKKVQFLAQLIEQLGLPNAQAIQARAEEAGHASAHRAGYDLVLARAVARLPALMEYMLPLARVGGMCVAMKGETAHEEAASAADALAALGGELLGIESVTLPDIDRPHYLVRVKKVRATPSSYPRRPGIPTRKPL